MDTPEALLHSFWSSWQCLRDAEILMIPESIIITHLTISTDGGSVAREVRHTLTSLTSSTVSFESIARDALPGEQLRRDGLK